MDAEQLATGTLLVAALGWLITHWVLSTIRRIKDLELKAGETDVQVAVVKANIDHIRKTLDETNADVKRILELNGDRAAG